MSQRGILKHHIPFNGRLVDRICIQAKLNPKDVQIKALPLICSGDFHFCPPTDGDRSLFLHPPSLKTHVYQVLNLHTVHMVAAVTGILNIETI